MKKYRAIAHSLDYYETRNRNKASNRVKNSPSDRFIIVSVVAFLAFVGMAIVTSVM